MAETEPIVAQLGLVVQTEAMFEHAIGLARGEPNLKTNPPPTVPRADMVAAHAIAERVAVYLRRWAARAPLVRWPLITATYATVHVNAAVASARRLESELRQILSGTSPSAPTVRSLPGGWPVVWLSDVASARDLFEIITGERPMEGSAIALAGEEITHSMMVGIPLLGEALLLFEAAAGHSVYNWRKLSGTEQLYALLSVILPLAAGKAIQLAGRGLVITKRAIAVALANTKFASAMVNVAGLRVTLRMTLGLRILPEKDFRDFLKLLSTTGKLSSSQATRFNFYLTRIDYVWRSASWLKHAKLQGKLSPGWHKIDGWKPKPGEPQALEDLTRLSRKRVISVPEVLPEHYKGPKSRIQMAGAKYPDGLLDNEMFDLWVAGTSEMDTVLGKIADKGRQANTAVIYLGGPKTKLSIDDVAKSLHRIWSDPADMYVDRVVLLTGKEIREFPRPTAFCALPGGIGFARSKPPSDDQMIKAAEEVDAEPDPQPPPRR